MNSNYNEKNNLISKRTVGRILVLLSTNGMYIQKKQKSDKNMCLQMVKIHYSLMLLKCDEVNSSHYRPAAKGIRFVWSIRFSVIVSVSQVFWESNIYCYRDFSPYVNFITANFVTTIFQNYNLANAILWAIYFVRALIS